MVVETARPQANEGVAVPGPSLLPDELVRDLIAVGQVDVLVGVPTFNNAATVARVVRAVHVGFAKYFPRARTLLINSDGGSMDGTVDAVRGAALDDAETVVARHALRTMHRISAPYHGLPGKRSALRTMFTAAELLQAKAVAVLEPDVTSVTPEWIASLISPVLHAQCDFVAPVYARERFEAPLATQLVRPLFDSTFGARVREPAGGEFGCSGRFVTQALAQRFWDDDRARPTIEMWLLANARAVDFKICQAHLGPRALADGRPRPPLPDLIYQVVGSLFACLDTHANYWLERQEVEDVSTFGQPAPVPEEGPAFEVAPMIEAFRSGVRDLDPILAQILSPGTLEGVHRAAASTDGVDISDSLWASTVTEFAAGYHREALNRDHLLKALVPIYLGRVAAFVDRHTSEPRPAFEHSLDALCTEYERSRPILIERWNSAGGR
jgi:hypothetical protein